MNRGLDSSPRISKTWFQSLSAGLRCRVPRVPLRCASGPEEGVRVVSALLHARPHWARLEANGQATVRGGTSEATVPEPRKGSQLQGQQAPQFLALTFSPDALGDPSSSQCACQQVKAPAGTWGACGRAGLSGDRRALPYPPANPLPRFRGS